jgi:hypothetical protein
MPLFFFSDKDTVDYTGTMADQLAGILCDFSASGNLF